MTTQITPLIRLHDAAMGYGERSLWRNVNLDILPGEFVMLLGANGCGKTTLFRVLLGLAKLKNGTVQRQANLHLGYVAQLSNFDPKIPLRGRDLVRLGLDGAAYCFDWWRKRPSRADKRALVQHALQEVNAEAFADAPLDLLSGGERQRLRIAQALVSEPPLLLLDEPLISLDPASQAGIAAILNHRKNYHHTAILMITHEIQPVLPLADTIVSLRPDGLHQHSATDWHDSAMGWHNSTADWHNNPAPAGHLRSA